MEDPAQHPTHRTIGGTYHPTLPPVRRTRTRRLQKAENKNWRRRSFLHWAKLSLGEFSL